MIPFTDPVGLALECPLSHCWIVSLRLLICQIRQLRKANKGTYHRCPYATYMLTHHTVRPTTFLKFFSKRTNQLQTALLERIRGIRHTFADLAL